jgi:DNA phosphorothioation-dependent restriction protein DptG
LFLDLFKNQSLKIKYLNQVLVGFRHHDNSKTIARSEQFNLEHLKVWIEEQTEADGSDSLEITRAMLQTIRGMYIQNFKKSLHHQKGVGKKFLELFNDPFVPWRRKIGRSFLKVIFFKNDEKL